MALYKALVLRVVGRVCEVRGWSYSESCFAFIVPTEIEGFRL